MAQLIFRNLADSRIEGIFEDMVKNYPPLELQTIILEKIQIKKTTMRAQPKLRTYLGSKKNRKFKVQMNSRAYLMDSVRMDQMPDDVIAGWFAHELGHIMDYLDRSLGEMLFFGLRYLLSHDYRKEVEHRADEIAIEYGMAKEILATKRFILEHSGLPESYKNRIRRYYMTEKNVHALLAHYEMEALLPEDANILEP